MHVFILLTVIGTFPFILVGGACPFRWIQFRDNCYRIMHLSYTWYEARRDCDQKDAHLVMIKDKDVQQFILGLKYGYDDQRYWIGLTDMSFENWWRWDFDGVFTIWNNKRYGYSNWNNGEPNNAGNNENCAYTDLNTPMSGKWNDIHCNTLLSHICQKHI